MLEFKKQVDALNFIIGTWKQEIEDVVNSPDFMKLTREQMEQLIIPNARALRFWDVQLDDYMDENMAVWKNRAAKNKSEELNITLEEAIKEYSFIKVDMEIPKAEPKVEPKPVEAPEVTSEESESIAISDEDALLQSMIKDKT